MSRDWANISAPTAATTVNPMVKSGGSSTPRAPPNTHASCSAVSERPNAEERAASGMSVWMEESSATLPSALAIAAISANTAAIQRVPRNAATTAADRADPAATVAIRPGRPSESRDPTALPANVPRPPAAPAMASSPACSSAVAFSCALATNARNRVRKPVMNRARASAHRVASTLRPSGRVSTALRPLRSEPRSTRREACSSSGEASACEGIVMATYAATSATAASSHSAAWESQIHATPAAAAPATALPHTCPSTVSRELVRTRSRAGGSTCGVMDALTTPNVLDSTSMPSASG